MKNITAVVEVLNTANRNGRIYSADGMKKAVDEYNIRTERFGMLGMPINGSANINLEKVSHKINELRIVGDDLVASITILDTPMGKILSGLPSISYRICGLGNFDENGLVTDFKFISVNACFEE